MQNNIKTGTIVTEETEVETKVVPPENCDVMLLNNALVSFEAVEDVLSEVLNIGRAKAMEIAITAHTRGRASVFSGPKDVAEQYQRTLTDYARAQHGEDTDGMGYDLLTFQVVKKEV